MQARLSHLTASIYPLVKVSCNLASPSPIREWWRRGRKVNNNPAYVRTDKRRTAMFFIRLCGFGVKCGVVTYASLTETICPKNSLNVP